MAINVNNFPNEQDGVEKSKIDLLKRAIGYSEADITGMTEIGRNEDLLPPQGRPSQVTKAWVEKGLTISDWNRRRGTSRYEPGGVMLLTKDKATAHLVKKGKDERRLGRWTWVTIKGKFDKLTTIISAYRPINEQVTSQNQLGTLRKIHPSKQPEDFWEEDLSTLIEAKKAEGEVIVMGDFNSDLNDTNGKVTRFFVSNSMREIILEKYGQGPPTHAWGTKTIDGIFATEGISIRQGGYGGFELSPTDHLFPWIDIEEEMIVGSSRDDRPPPILKKATSKIPSVKNAFNQILNEEVTTHKLHEKVQRIFNSAKRQHRLTQEEEAEYENLDDRLIRGVKCADSGCRKARMGTVPFSKKQKELLGKIYVLKTFWRRHKLKNSNHIGRPKWKKIKRMMKKYSYNGPTSFESLHQIKEELKKAASQYHQFRPKAHEARDDYRSQLAYEISVETGRDQERVYKDILHRDKTKEHFRRIKAKEKRGAKSGVDRVDIETENGLRTLVNKTEIETAILAANKEKLLQARHTPLRMEPLRSIIGERMEYDTWEKLLRKEIQVPEDLEEGTRLWFEAVQNFDDDPVTIEWTTEEYFQSWKLMSEDKSSLPGIQAAHIKSVDPSSKAADVISKMALIPLLTGYAPKNWKRGIDSMIPKKKDEWRPSKLRLILLMDARFNHNNKLIGKKMMEHGEKRGFLAREQFGSRKSKSAIEHALNKRLTIDIARQSKTPAVYIANDAKSCYDRILLMIAYLTMRQVGIPELAAKSSIDTLVQMTRKVKTVYGISDESYATDKPLDEILHGIGQGNGYGPSIWAGISSPLLKILRKRKVGVNIATPITREELKMAGYSFVDDTDLIELNGDETIWENVVENAQEGLKLWECLLRTTGGAIEPSKTDWGKIMYEWKNGVAKLQKAHLNDTLWTKDPEGIEKQIKQIEPDQARRTLGVWQAANGQEETQKEVLISKIKAWGTNTIGITRKETATASVSTLGRSIRYPLAATAMNTEQCKAIDKQLKKQVLGKRGVVRTAPDIVAFSPKKSGGIGLHRTEVDQTIDQAKMILHHGHKETVTGTLIRNTAEQMAIESGYGGDPFGINLDKIDYLTEHTWIERAIRNFQFYEIKIQTSMKGITNWTMKDDFLMERATKVLSGANLKIFNNVRLYLQVATTSDLAIASGMSVDKEILYGKRGHSPTPSRASYKWPNIPCPTLRERRIWTEGLCYVYNITTNDPLLEYNNYRWFEHRAVLNTQWNLDTAAVVIFQRTGVQQWKKWTLTQNTDQLATRRNIRFTLSPQDDARVTEFKNWVPLSIKYEDRDTISIVSRGRYHRKSKDNDLRETWFNPIRTQISTREENKYVESIVRNEGLVVGDGSYKSGQSAAAFVVNHTKTDELEKIYRNVQVLDVPGHPDDQHSYRAELGGILAGIVYTNSTILKRSRQTQREITGKCTFACDNKGALDASFGWKIPNPNWTCYDLVAMIRHHLQRSPVRWEGLHVKGHQDDKTQFCDLPRVSQANVLADREAKRQLRASQPSEGEYHGTKGEPWSILCQGKRISGTVEASLRYLMQDKKAAKWWMDRFFLQPQTHNKINWNVYTEYRDRTPKWLNIWSVKFGANLLPTRKNLVTRGHGNEHTCPCCGAANEDADHIFRCPNAEIEKTFQDERETIRSFLEATTSPAIGDGVLEVLQSLRKQRDLILTEGEYGTLAREQLHLGIRATLNGVWLHEWVLVQKDYIKKMRETKNAEVWLIRLTLLIQRLVHSLWLTRNEAIHKKEDSAANTKRHEELNGHIDEIYRTLPRNRRVLPASDRAFFSKGAHSAKTHRLRKKESWVDEAKRIRDAFFDGLNVQSERFLDYFDGTI